MQLGILIYLFLAAWRVAQCRNCKWASIKKYLSMQTRKYLDADDVLMPSNLAARSHLAQYTILTQYPDKELGEWNYEKYLQGGTELMEEWSKTCFQKHFQNFFVLQNWMLKYFLFLFVQCNVWCRSPIFYILWSLHRKYRHNFKNIHIFIAMMTSFLHINISYHLIKVKLPFCQN